MFITGGILPHTPVYVLAAAESHRPITDATKELLDHFVLRGVDTVLVLYESTHAFECVVRQGAELIACFPRLEYTMMHGPLTTDIPFSVRVADAIRTVIPVYADCDSVISDHEALSLLPLSEYDFSVVVAAVPFVDKHDLIKMGKRIRHETDRCGTRIGVLISGVLSQTVSNISPFPYNRSGAQFDAVYKHSWQNGNLISLIESDANTRTRVRTTALAPTFVFSGFVAGDDAAPHILMYDTSLGVGTFIASYRW